VIAQVYIAGPYRAKTPWDVEQNIRRAEAVAMIVAKHGAYPVCPHTNTRGWFESVQPGGFWLEATLELMRRCDAVVLVEGWTESVGAKAEWVEADKMKLPIFAECDVGDARWRAFIAAAAERVVA